MNGCISFLFYITVYYSYVDYHVQHVSGTPSWFWGFSHLARLLILLLLFPKQWIYDLVVLWCSSKTKPKRQFYGQACLRFNNYIVFGSVIAVFLWTVFVITMIKICVNDGGGVEAWW